MSFRENLQHLRATHHMTQEQLAMLLGVSRQSVTKWESGKSNPEMDKLLKLCEIFGCTLDDLVCGDLTSRPVEPTVAMPDAAPTDVCGYDEERRSFARSVSAAVACFILGPAVSSLLVAFGRAVDIDHRLIDVLGALPVLGLAAAGIAVAPGVTLDTRLYDASDRFAADGERFLDLVDEAGLQYPLFVKPSRAGSSFGVTKVERVGDAEELAAAVYEASLHDWRVIVEQGIDAREIECAVLRPRGEEEPRVSLPGEIVLDRRAQDDDQFYDFDSKYMDAQASHAEVPAHIPDELIERVRATALKAFLAIDGTGLSRVDTFVTPGGDVLVNEINTMPGFTSISMYPKAWDATGIAYTDLITTLILGALHR